MRIVFIEVLHEFILRFGEIIQNTILKNIHHLMLPVSSDDQFENPKISNAFVTLIDLPLEVFLTSLSSAGFVSELDSVPVGFCSCGLLSCLMLEQGNSLVE